MTSNTSIVSKHEEMWQSFAPTRIEHFMLELKNRKSGPEGRGIPTSHSINQWPPVWLELLTPA